MLEADFQREYKLNMADALPGMSWRRFLVLVRGLGPQSAWVAMLTHRAQQPRVITDPDAAEAYMESLG